MKRVISFVIVCLLAMVGAAQAQILTGNIIGSVKDESGAVLPGVTVTLASPTGLPAGPVTVVTTANGEYRFTQLRPGSYSLTVTLPGFSTYQEDGLQVAVGGTIERIVALKLATVAESITVSGESPMVDPRRVAVTTNLPQQVLENIPTMRYGFHEYVKWAPGVSSTDPQGNTGSASVLGSSTSENLFLYEGVNSNDPSNGGLWLGGAVNAIEEVQVVTLGASAEYQVAQGAVFNAVVKSGTNVLRGQYTQYWFSDRLISKPIKLSCNCSLGQTGYSQPNRTDYFFDAGGPVIKDRLWFFGAGIFNNRKETGPGVDPRIPFKFYQKAVLGKLSWNINERLKVSGMYNPKWRDTPPIPSQSRPIETITGNSGRSRTYSGEFTATLTNKTLITARSTGWYDPDARSFSFVGDLVTPYRVDSLTGIACCGVQDFGTAYRWLHGQSAKLNQYVAGAHVTHDLGVGVQLEEAGRYDFNTLPSGVNYSDVGGRPDQATFRSAWVQGADYRSFGVWVADQVSLWDKLTLSLGVRWDRMRATSPDEPAIDNQLKRTGATIKGRGDMFTWHAVAPRAGVNLKLTADGKTVLRSTYGRAYRTIYLNDFTIVHPGLSPTTLARYNPATGGYTTIISVTDPLANIAVDPNSEAPFTDQYSVGLDRELVANLGVGVTYVHKEGQKQIGWKDIGGIYGTQAAVLPDGRTVTVYPLLNRTSERKFLRTNGPGTFNGYNGVVVSMEKRMSHRWQSQVSYTYSKSEGLTTTAQDPNGDINNGGLLSTDRPQMFVAVASYLVPRINGQAAVNFMALSGTPFAPQALVQLPQGRTTINIDNADGTYRLDSQQILFFRYNQVAFRRGSFRVELMAELANALQNKANQGVVSRNLFSATFNQPSSWTLPRRLYFSTAVKF